MHLEAKIKGDCYYSQIDLMRDLVSHKTNWRDYAADEKLIVENTVLLVGAIYAMCKVQLVVNSEEEEETELNIKVINKKEASKARKRGKELYRATRIIVYASY